MIFSNHQSEMAVQKHHVRKHSIDGLSKQKSRRIVTFRVRIEMLSRFPHPAVSIRFNRRQSFIYMSTSLIGPGQGFTPCRTLSSSPIYPILTQPVPHLLSGQLPRQSRRLPLHPLQAIPPCQRIHPQMPKLLRLNDFPHPGI
jgi:hypothetical protein